jgi:hypothetical protein
MNSRVSIFTLRTVLVMTWLGSFLLNGRFIMVKCGAESTERKVLEYSLSVDIDNSWKVCLLAIDYYY